MIDALKEQNLQLASDLEFKSKELMGLEQLFGEFQENAKKMEQQINYE